MSTDTEHFLDINATFGAMLVGCLVACMCVSHIPSFTTPNGLKLEVLSWLMYVTEL
ncbi:hypothetical protein D9613_009321 [Agrocybe pediades]|uniref:Uncharacterized protein n=1 Tax=Agrocybe pediades TaxID=84607 RepID=A0A8H4R2D6_9AGAR|nr:hypothetical protein D9613_009321 [Agrocybe pediades]